MPGPDDETPREPTCETSSPGVGAETLAVVLGAVERANERSIDAVTQQSQSMAARITIIVLVALMLLGGAIGISTSLSVGTDGTTIETETPVELGDREPDELGER